MNKIVVQPTVWAAFGDASVVDQISDRDSACLQEIRDVLARHNALDRFGVSLLHTHYAIADDEILLETTDVSDRTQFIRPVKISDYVGREDISLMATCLKLVEGDAVAIVQCGCMRDKHGHTGRHG